MRAEVLFINTKEFTVRWGTANAINIPAPNLPGGIPIRSHGTYNFKVHDYIKLIDKIAGVKSSYCVEDVRLRITSFLDQYLMKWIAKEGKDMFNLTISASDIASGMKTDLDMKLFDSGISITDFNIMSFTYPEEIQKAINKNASQSMIGDVNRYQQINIGEGIANGNVRGGGVASDMTGMMMGMQMANTMMQGMNQNMQQMNQNMQGMNQNTQGMNPNSTAANPSVKPNFCPNCGQKTGTANFCPNCGQKLI